MTRQKNCDNCVQTKGRCDRRAPECSRCIERGLPCVFRRGKTGSRTTDGFRSAPEQAPSSSSAAVSTLVPPLNLDAGMTNGLGMNPTRINAEAAVQPGILFSDGSGVLATFLCTRLKMRHRWTSGSTSLMEISSSNTQVRPWMTLLSKGTKICLPSV